jgi:hypothetical protein
MSSSWNSNTKHICKHLRECPHVSQCLKLSHISQLHRTDNVNFELELFNPSPKTDQQTYNLKEPVPNFIMGWVAPSGGVSVSHAWCALGMQFLSPIVKNSELRKYSTVLSTKIPAHLHKKIELTVLMLLWIFVFIQHIWERGNIRLGVMGVLPVLCVLYLYANSSCELDQLLFCKFLRW